MTTINQTELNNTYNKIKSQYSQIFKKYIELEDQKRENNLVLVNLEPLKGDRRCWKVLGGVLVQHTMPQAVQSLKQNVSMIQQTLNVLESEMKKREKEITELELKYNLNPNNKSMEEESNRQSKDGVLA